MPPFQNAVPAWVRHPPIRAGTEPARRPAHGWMSARRHRRRRGPGPRRAYGWRMNACAAVRVTEPAAPVVTAGAAWWMTTEGTPVVSTSNIVPAGPWLGPAPPPPANSISSPSEPSPPTSDPVSAEPPVRPESRGSPPPPPPPRTHDRRVRRKPERGFEPLTCRLQGEGRCGCRPDLTADLIVGRLSRNVPRNGSATADAVPRGAILGRMGPKSKSAMAAAQERDDLRARAPEGS